MRRAAGLTITMLVFAVAWPARGQQTATATEDEASSQSIAPIPAQTGLPIASPAFTVGNLAGGRSSVARPAPGSDLRVAPAASRWTAGNGQLAGTAALPGHNERGSSLREAPTGQGSYPWAAAPLMENAERLMQHRSTGNTARSDDGTESAFRGAQSTQQSFVARTARGHQPREGVAPSDDNSDSDHGPQRNATSFPVAPTAEGMTIRLMATADGLQLVLQSKSGMNGSILADRSGISRNKGDSAPGWWSWSAGRGSWEPVNVLTSSPLSHVGDPGEALTKKLHVDPQTDK